MRKFDALGPGLGNEELKHHFVFCRWLMILRRLIRVCPTVWALPPSSLGTSDIVTWTNVFSKESFLKGYKWRLSVFQSTFKFNNSFLEKRLKWMLKIYQCKIRALRWWWTVIEGCHLSKPMFSDGSTSHHIFNRAGKKTKPLETLTLKSLNCVPVK